MPMEWIGIMIGLTVWLGSGLLGVLWQKKIANPNQKPDYMFPPFTTILMGPLFWFFILLGIALFLLCLFLDALYSPWDYGKPNPSKPENKGDAK